MLRVLTDLTLNELRWQPLLLDAFFIKHERYRWCRTLELHVLYSIFCNNPARESLEDLISEWGGS